MSDRSKGNPDPFWIRTKNLICPCVLDQSQCSEDALGGGAGEGVGAQQGAGDLFHAVDAVGVAGGGCSGFQYSLGFDTNWDPKADSKSEQHGVAVVELPGLLRPAFTIALLAAIESLLCAVVADGMIGGLGRVNGHPVVAMSYDYTVLAGTQGGQNHRKKDRLFELAEQMHNDLYDGMADEIVAILNRSDADRSTD